MNSELMNKGDVTRLKLLQAGAELFHLQGYNNTGLQQILKQANVVKGSFYFHFKDKESFALAIIDFYQNRFREELFAHFLDPKLSAKQKLDGFHQYHLNALEHMDCKGGCPLGNFSLEMADISDNIAAKLRQAFSRMSRTFASVVEQGQREGSFNPDLNPGETADFLINSWEGAMLRSKAEQSSEPMNNWFEFAKRILGNP